jgi:hypothetical protein
LEDAADVIEHKRKVDLEAIVDYVKERFQTNSRGVKKFKQNTSDNEEEEQYSLAFAIADYLQPHILLLVNVNVHTVKNKIIDFDGN